MRCEQLCSEIKDFRVAFFFFFPEKTVIGHSHPSTGKRMLCITYYLLAFQITHLKSLRKWFSAERKDYRFEMVLAALSMRRQGNTSAGHRRLCGLQRFSHPSSVTAWFSGSAEQSLRILGFLLPKPHTVQHSEHSMSRSAVEHNPSNVIRVCQKEKLNQLFYCFQDREPHLRHLPSQLSTPDSTKSQSFKYHLTLLQKSPEARCH